MKTSSMINDSVGKTWLVGAVAAMTAIASPNAHAQVVQNAISNLASQPTLTGNWGGVRTTLQDDGISLFGSYLSMFNGNVSGGEKQTNTNAQQILLGANVDLGKVAGIEGGTLHVDVVERMGLGLGTYGVGSVFQEQTIYGGGATLRLMELSYGQTFDDKKLYTEIGYSYEGEYFASTPDFGLFPSQAFNEHPPVYFNSGWADAPVSHLGGLARYQISNKLYAETGLWDVNPNVADSNHGFYLSLKGSTGFITPVEFGLTEDWLGSQLPGTLKIGGYYDSSTVASASGDGQNFTGRYGGYFLASQTVYRAAANSTRALTMYFQVVKGDARTAKVPLFYAFGMMKEGTFPGRPTDDFGVAFYGAMVNPRARQYQTNLLAQEGADYDPLQLGEYGLNVAYAFNVTPWLNLSPNFQYIINPGAFSYEHTSNATVFGVTTQVIF